MFCVHQFTQNVIEEEFVYVITACFGGSVNLVLVYRRFHCGALQRARVKSASDQLFKGCSRARGTFAVCNGLISVQAG